MRIVHKLGYISVFDEANVRVYTEEEYLDKAQFLFDPNMDTEEWHDYEPTKEILEWE